MDKSSEEQILDCYKLLELYVKSHETCLAAQHVRNVLGKQIENDAVRWKLPVNLQISNKTIKISRLTNGNIYIDVK